MYLEHFGLKDVPFSIAPDPRYLYMSEGHREALAHLLYGMSSDGGFVLLTGEVGTGKTTVCRCLLEKVPQDTEIAFILNPKLTAAELLAAVCDEFGIGHTEGSESIKVLVDRINAYLLAACESGKRAVLIIEEAQNLSAEVLEQLRLLTNLETNRRKLLQIILLGQPELREMLGRAELRQLGQRITARYHLGPLSRKETAAYILHRLGIAGCTAELFPGSVVKKIFGLSGGIPRLINVICDRALLGAFVEGKSTVDRHTLSRAAHEALGKRRQPLGQAAYGWAAAGVMLVVLAALSGSSYLHFGPTPVSMENRVTSPQGQGQYSLDVWQRAGDFFPLLSMQSPYRRLAGGQGGGFGEAHRGRVIVHDSGPDAPPSAAPGEKVKSAKSVSAGGYRTKPGLEMSDESRGGTENVIHP